MKTFTATQLNKKPQEVFAAVNEDGCAEIEHSRFPTKKYIIIGTNAKDGDLRSFDADMRIINRTYNE